MNMSKLCVIYNSAPHYRSAVFKKMDEEYDCDWYFGETKNDIREMDCSVLGNVVFCKCWGRQNRAYWIKGVVPLVFKKKYQTFLMLGDPRVLSYWLFWLLAFVFFPKKKIYIWSHAWYGKETKMEARLKLWLYRHATAVMPYGDYAKRCLVEHGIDAEKIRPIKNSLDYGRQLQVRRQMTESDIYRTRFKNGSPTILFIGRLTLIKRLNLLVEAVEQLKSKGEDYNVVLVGDGPERANLQHLVKAKGLSPNFWFYGACYNEVENGQLVYNADLCVSPGNVGLTAIHAMMFGTPVVTHSKFEFQVPEFEAVKPGVTGDFFEYGDVDSLSKCISDWFRNSVGRRGEIRKRCFDEVDSFWNPDYQMKVIKGTLGY